MENTEIYHDRRRNGSSRFWETASKERAKVEGSNDNVEIQRVRLGNRALEETLLDLKVGWEVKLQEDPKDRKNSKGLPTLRH